MINIQTSSPSITDLHFLPIATRSRIVYFAQPHVSSSGSTFHRACQPATRARVCRCGLVPVQWCMIGEGRARRCTHLRLNATVTHACGPSNSTTVGTTIDTCGERFARTGVHIHRARQRHLFRCRSSTQNLAPVVLDFSAAPYFPLRIDQL